MTGIDWPDALERTPPEERQQSSNFRAPLGGTTSDLAREMRRLDPDDWRASFGNSHAKSNGLPLHNANPDDPGFVMRWTDDGDQYAVACDAYASLRDNVRSVCKWIHETRMRAQRPVKTAESEFATARLPPADEDAIAAPAPSQNGQWGRFDGPADVLAVDEDADPGEIRAAYRDLAKELHPDNGGDRGEFELVCRAKEAMLDE